MFQCEVETWLTVRELQRVGEWGHNGRREIASDFQLDEQPVITIVKQPKATGVRRRPGK